MPYTIAIFPKFDGMKKIDFVRDKYYPNNNGLELHVALVYYFNERPDKSKIRKVAKSFSSFNIRLNEIRKSSQGNYIFLDVSGEKNKIIEIKDKLYDELKLKWDKDFLYEPHFSIAKLETESKRDELLEDIRNEGFDFSCKIDSFVLLEMDDDLITVKSEERFDLG